MNIEMTDLDMILNYLETTSLEPHDDYTSEITYKDQKILYRYIKELQQENQQLKIQIIAREKEYRKLYETNKVLSQELTKDKFLKQDHLTTCCGIPIGDIPKLIEKNRKLEQENQQLKDTWNKLKEYIEQEISVPMGGREFCCYSNVRDKIKELERGVSDDED